MLHFSIENARGEPEKYEAGCGLTVSCLFLGSSSDRPCIVINDVSSVFGHFHDILPYHFLWQAQYLGRLEGDTSGFAHLHGRPGIW